MKGNNEQIPEEIKDLVRGNQKIITDNQSKIVEIQGVVKKNQENISQAQQVLQTNQRIIIDNQNKIHTANIQLECVRNEHFLVGIAAFSLSVLVVWLAEMLIASEHLPPKFHLVMAALFFVPSSVALVLMFACRKSTKKLVGQKIKQVTPN